MEELEPVRSSVPAWLPVLFWMSPALPVIGAAIVMVPAVPWNTALSGVALLHAALTSPAIDLSTRWNP